MNHNLFFFFIASLTFLLISLSESELHQSSSPLNSTSCHDNCSSFNIPFPFFSNSTCNNNTNTSSPVRISAFLVSCLNQSAMHLHIGAGSYRVIDFFSDGVLVEFPASPCGPYSDLNAFGFTGNDFFSISEDNVLGLYDCEDSSPCKADCETIDLLPRGSNDSCGNVTAASPPSCCYPLSDHSEWRHGDGGEGFSVFAKYGCRGASCWVVPRGSTSGTRGVKLEWAVPRNNSAAACSDNAYVVNATAVGNGVRCECQEGFVGDGFAAGKGCLKSCFKDGQETEGNTCYTKKPHYAQRRNTEIIAGLLALVIIFIVAIFCRGRRSPREADRIDRFRRVASFQKSIKSSDQLLSYHYRQLEEATAGFSDDHQIAPTKRLTGRRIYHGVLGDGSPVLVHKIDSIISDEERARIMTQIRTLSSSELHRNMARIIGFSDDAVPLLVVYESTAYAIGTTTTVDGYLRTSGTIRNEFGPLDWSRRLHIATETAKLLAFLQYENLPPIVHYDLSSSFILVDCDDVLAVKVFGFELVGNLECNNVYNFGVVLLEIISGASRFTATAAEEPNSLPMFALKKLRSGRLEEIVDPDLLLEHQRHGEIEIVADLATRCLVFGREGGKLTMIDVVKELVQLSMSSSVPRGHAIEETFSNSSLLQMISMSPDSIHLPH